MKRKQCLNMIDDLDVMLEKLIKNRVYTPDQMNSTDKIFFGIAYQDCYDKRPTDKEIQSRLDYEIDCLDFESKREEYCGLKEKVSYIEDEHLIADNAERYRDVNDTLNNQTFYNDEFY